MSSSLNWGYLDPDLVCLVKGLLMRFLFLLVGFDVAKKAMLVVVVVVVFS